MFCRKCGKDIGDSKFCPDCGTKQDSTDEVKAEPVTGEAPKTEAPKVEAPVYKNPYEPDKDTPSFNETLKKECKGYKALDIIDTVRTILCFAVPITFILLAWILNSGEKFVYIALTGLELSLPIVFFLIFIEVPLSVGMLIIYLVKMHKMKPSNKELFKSVCPGGDGDYSFGLNIPDFSPWEAISFKYQKTSFVIAIVQRVLYIIEWTFVWLMAVIAIPAVAPIAQAYGLFTNGFGSQMINSLRGVSALIIAFIVIDIILSIVKGVLNSVRTKSHRKLIEQLRTGELDK